MTALPKLMVAPNGARLGKSDHPEVPVTLDEIIETAKACHGAGADGLHLHLRDQNGGHVLDSGLYREALQELSLAVPTMVVQVTTEAVGMYNSAQQREVALNSGARLVSTSIREIMTDTSKSTALRFFEDCNSARIDLQFILYDLADLELLHETITEANFQAPGLQVLFVLGRYSVNRNSSPEDLQPYLDWMNQNDWSPDWAICAFGAGETDCLMAAHSQGGKLRVGFENSLFTADGMTARDNAHRVQEISALISGMSAV